MILIAYDGSPDAKAAIEHTARLCRPDEPVTVLTVWQRFIDTMARAGAGAALGAPGLVDSEEIDRASEQGAAEKAEEGVAIAREAGLDAHPRSVVFRGSVADTIVHQADIHNAQMIVLGSRGLTGIKSLVLGSVSHGVLVHADRPVLVVPSPTAAKHRAERLHHEGAAI